MTSRPQRPAGYIRVARGSGTGTAAGERHAILEEARARGWSEPAVYLDVDDVGTAPEAGSALAQLAAAISTGQHDALILGGLGTICQSPADLAGLLRGCARNGVAVECATGLAAACGGSGPPLPGRGRLA